MIRALTLASGKHPKACRTLPFLSALIFWTLLVVAAYPRCSLRAISSSSRRACSASAALSCCLNTRIIQLSSHTALAVADGFMWNAVHHADQITCKQSSHFENVWGLEFEIKSYDEGTFEGIISLFVTCTNTGTKRWPGYVHRTTLPS